MALREKEQDILQDLFARVDADNEAAPAVQALTRLIEQYTEKPGKSACKAGEGNGAGSDAKSARSTRVKRKTTCYMSIDISEALEDAKEELRSLVSPNLKHLVSKSRIVEMAVQYVLAELGKNGPKSKLIQAILQEKKIAEARHFSAGHTGGQE